MHSSPRRLFAHKIFQFTRMRTTFFFFFFFFATQTVLQLNVQHHLPSPFGTAAPPSLCPQICRMSVVHPWIQRSPAAIGSHMTRQFSRNTLMLEVESSSFLNICLQAQLFKIKTLGLRSCWTMAVRGALDSKVIIIRFMSKFCPIQRIQTTMASLALLMLSRKTYGIDPVWLSDFPHRGQASWMLMNFYLHCCLKVIWEAVADVCIRRQALKRATRNACGALQSNCTDSEMR